MRRLLLLTAGVLALSACDRPASDVGRKGAEPAAPTASAFAYAATGDLSGYYIPVSETRVDKWVLHDVFVGQAADFESWSAGERSGTFAPVMLEFEDPGSPMVQTEMGESPSGRARVLPTRFEVSDDRIHFEGRSAELGAVTFDGRLDQAALAVSRRNLGEEGAVMSGALTAGGKRVTGVRLRWWMGD